MFEWSRRIGYQAEDFNRLNVLHVTGTKGKGSTCSFIQSILTQYKSDSGRITKIGLYTSPHIKSVRERISINGKPISEELFARYFFEVWDKLNSSQSDVTKYPGLAPGLKPLYFKYLTLLSFHVFMREGVDTAIYEVGVGGELDSTNIIQAPTCCGITSLGIDHTFMLGDTIEEIAWNKAGIFKPNASVFTVPQPLTLMKVIEERAQEKRVESLKVVNPRDDLEGIKLGLNGDFQKINASIAIEMASRHLVKLGFENVQVDERLPEKFVTGLERASIMGRCQTIVENDQLSWFIDGAHTKESIDVSSKWFSQVASAKKKKILLFNQQTRDVEVLIKILFNNIYPDLKFDHVIFTTNQTWSMGYDDDLVSINTSKESVDKLEVQKKLLDIWNTLDKSSRKHIFPDIETSVNFIRSLEGPLEVFVCGSLHLVGGFLVVLDGKDTK